MNQAGQGLCEGDVVTRINNTAITDAITLKEARKLIESCKDRLNLVVTRELIREETVTNGNYQNNYNSLGESVVVFYTSDVVTLLSVTNYTLAPVTLGTLSTCPGPRHALGPPWSLFHYQTTTDLLYSGMKIRLSIKKKTMCK